MLHTLPLSQPKRASTVRVKRPPSVRNKRRTRGRISDEEIGFEEASASCGQNKQGAEDVRGDPAGHEPDKLVVEDVRQVPAGRRHEKQGAEDVRSSSRLWTK